MKRIFAILSIMTLTLSPALTATPVTAQNDTIEVPGDYPTIQQAIAAASDGDTIVVAAGSYKESVTVDKSLTLKGAQAGVDARNRSGEETIIEPDEGAGIRILTVADRVVVIDGFTVQNTLHGITTPEPGVMAADIIVRNMRVLNASEWGISLAFTERTTVEYCYVEGLQYGISAGALQPYPPTEAVFRHNEVAKTRHGITGYLRDALIEDNLVRDFTQGGTGISGQFLNTDIRNNTVTGYTRGAAITFEAHYGRDLPEDVTVEQNTLTGNSIGVYIFDTQTELDGITVNNNNIAGNTRYGVWNEGGETLDATRNWWGHVSGPNAMGPGSGDDVSRKVIYSPWLGTELGTEPMAWGVDTTSSIQEAIDAADPGDSVIVTEGQYSEDLTIGKSLTLLSTNGADETTVTGSVSIELDAGTVILGGEDAGFTVDANGGDFAVWLSADNESDVTISHNTLTGATDGISTRNGLVNNSLVNMEENRLYKNDFGIYLESVTGDSSLLVNFNSLAQNDDHGLYIQSSTVTVEGTFNWWGHASGPSGGVVDPVSGRTADGEGSAVSGHVRFDPWITAYLNTIEVSSTDGGSVIRPGEGAFTHDAGTEIELVALADAFYRFDGWTGDVDTIANVRSADTTLILNGDYSITANFKFLLFCFVATAAYGSDTADEIHILTEFRDSVLMRSRLGTGFVSFYYKAGPPLADFISRHEGLRTLARVGLLDPVVRIVDSTRHLWSDGD